MWAEIDEAIAYEEMNLPDGRMVQRRADGSVRVVNLKSGIIQEERADGSLILSMASGKYVFQEYRGEPLVVYDDSDAGQRLLARVGRVSLPGFEQARCVIFFEDYEGAHLIDLETLRYYRVNKPPGVL